MYVPSGSGLGFSLKPPKWLRNAVINPIKQIVGGGTVTVPTPAGPVEIARPSEPSPTQQFVNSVPGGGTTLAIGAAVGLGLLMLNGRKRRRR